MLPVGLETRHNAFLCRAAGRTGRRECPQVLTLDKGQTRWNGPAAENCSGRRGRSRAIAAITVKRRIHSTDTWVVESIDAVVPVLTTERTDGDVQFHDVVEDAIAAEHLHATVFEHIPSRPDTRSNLVSPTEVDRTSRSSSTRAFARQILSFDSQPKVQSDTAANRPGVLREEAMVVASSLTTRSEVEHGNVAILTLALPIQSNKRSAVRYAERSRRLVRCRRIVSDESLRKRLVVTLQDVVG